MRGDRLTLDAGRLRLVQPPAKDVALAWQITVSRRLSGRALESSVVPSLTEKWV